MEQIVDVPVEQERWSKHACHLQCIVLYGHIWPYAVGHPDLAGGRGDCSYPKGQKFLQSKLSHVDENECHESVAL